MTLQQLDDVLKVWQGRLSAMAENLLELQADANYRSLTGDGGLTKQAVTGVTAARIAPALGSVHQLFRDFGALQTTVEQAVALRRDLPALFGADAKAREIQRLLFTASIVVEGGDVPLAERVLLSDATRVQRSTPEDLMQGMARRFAEVRDAVETAGRAWTEFAEAGDQVEGEIARLQSQRTLPSALLTPALGSLERTVLRVRKAAETDPIGALADLRNQAEPALAEVAARVMAAEQTAARLRLACGRWEELQRSQTAVVAALEELNACISAQEPRLEAVAEPKLQGLADWLRRLEARFEDGAPQAVTVGLRNWMAAADVCLAENGRVLAISKERMANRDELRGRLRALKAKARANKAQSGEETAALESEAERLLCACPVDLRAAVAAMTAFEARLRTGKAAGTPPAPLRGITPP